MAPKPKKSPTRSKSPKKPDNTANNNNDATFFSNSLNEDEWKALVAIVVPSEPFEELYIDQLEKTVKNGVRRRFSWLSKKDLIDLIIENTGKKAASQTKKPPGTVPLPQPLLLAIESCKQYIENKEEIPDNLMAQLIKGKLVHMKTIEKEKELARARAPKKPAAISTTGAKNQQPIKKDKSPTGKKSPTKGAAKKANQGPLPEIEKQSQLKRKEDIEDEEKYLDDEPKDGANHYIILSGFYSPGLFNYIDEFNIPIDCLIKFKSKSYDLIKSFEAEIEERERLETNLKSNLKINNDVADKNGQINVDALNEQRRAYFDQLKLDLDKYWTDSNTILEKCFDKPIVQHIARIKLQLKQDPQLKSWFELESRAEFSQKMYNELSERLFALVIQKRHYGFYINNLKLYSIPSSNPVLTFPASSGGSQAHDFDKLYDIRYYNELMNSIPPEYSSPSVVLYCMIEQVVANEEKRELPSDVIKKSSTTADQQQNSGLSAEVNHHFGKIIENLALNEQDKLQLANLLPLKSEETEESIKETLRTKPTSSPHLINYHDEIGARLKGVFDESLEKRKGPNRQKLGKLLFDPNEVEAEMLGKSVWTVFTGLPQVSAKVAKERAARLQELLHFCSSPEITNADVDRAFKQFVFETMNLSEVSQKRNYVKQADKNQLIPWDDPYPNISATLSEEQQLVLKTLNTLDAKREFEEEMKKRRQQAPNERVTSASTTKSIKFQDNEFMSESLNRGVDNGRSSILKSRSSKMSGF